jgi:hypothetical protein
VRRSVRIALRVVLLIVLAVLAVPGYFIVRGVFFPPTFDVPSIAGTPAYQDPALLERAWALPVASAYGSSLQWQDNGSTCGPASLANVQRSLGTASTEDAVKDAGDVCSLGICMGGLSLDELADVARAATGREVTVLRDLGLDQFRQEMMRTNDPDVRYVINFHRGLLFGKGTGHHSPIGGYLPDQDLVFVLDVNEKFGPWLVDTERLFRAMDEVDGSTDKKRGLLRIEAQ